MSAASRLPTSTPLHVLYLDYDGVLHPAGVYRYRKPPAIRLGAPGHTLFENCEMLQSLLTPYPDVRIVLSTSWVRALGFDEAKEYLTPELKARVIGATFHSRIHLSDWFSLQYRYRQIIEDVGRRKPAAWLAVDDDAEGWPDEQRSRLAYMPESLGLSDPSAQCLLRKRLAEHFFGAETARDFTTR